MTEASSLDAKMFGRITELPISPKEYYELVGKFNLLIQSEIAKKLGEHTSELGDAVALVMPGSDGRFEKGSMVSVGEVTALVSEKVDPDVYSEALMEVVRKSCLSRTTKIMEIKGPRESMAVYKGAKMQPGRIADSSLIYGSEQALHSAKQALGQEIIAMRRDDVDEIAELRRDARKVTVTGVNRISGKDALHFDLAADPVTKKANVWFNPDANRLSFKIGPLRLVQNTLLMQEVMHTRKARDANFISTLHTNIGKRLDQLSDDKMLNLNKDSVREIVEHYAFFLRLYHRSEHLFEQRGQVVMELDEKEVEEVAKRLTAISELMQSLKIERQKQ